MTPRGAIALLHRLDLKLLCPRTIPAKSSPEQKEVFKTTFDQRIQQLDPCDHVFFFDGATVQYSASKTRVWAKKGEQPTIPIIGGRQKMHLIGVVEPAGDKGWFATCPTLGASELIGFFKGLLTQYPIGQLLVVLDNARAHHAKKVIAFQIANPRIELFYLPPYSPDLNPIELFWKYLRQQVTHNTYYPTFEAFQTAVIEFLTQFKVPKGIIYSLCNFYRIPIKQALLGTVMV
jgi:transposase